jgi:hypothetical protein
MDDILTLNWAATVSIEQGAPASGDIAFVAIDSTGSPSSLNYDRLEGLRISPAQSLTLMTSLRDIVSLMSKSKPFALS